MVLILSAILFPILSGAVLALIKSEKLNHGSLCIYSGVTLCIELVLALAAVFISEDKLYEVFKLTSNLAIAFKFDDTGRIFAVVMALVWVLIGFYSFEYMKHEQNNKTYYVMYILTLGVLMGLCEAGNLITYYAFFELLTLSSFALVLHNRTREAIFAALKFMFYSFAGAYMVLFGLYFVYKYSGYTSMNFIFGGLLTDAATDAAGSVMPVAMLLMIMGFGVKAGMFPMSGWLPTAHPVAPAPASAALSGIIVKAGVLGIIRVIYYVFGVGYFKDSKIQTIVLSLSLITVFTGSMLAYKEKVLKKRLAYSTVSQVSYILFGLFIASETSYNGAIIHVAAHAAIKSVLFMCAGAIIHITGCTKVDELKGIGLKMPVLMWCYTIVSLGLIGIPPFGGFVSKWYLCVGAMERNIKFFSWAGPVVLLVSALLTAGYLLPISINGFLPGASFREAVARYDNYENIGEDMKETIKAYKRAYEPKLLMLIPIIILTVLSVIIGIFPGVVLW